MRLSYLSKDTCCFWEGIEVADRIILCLFALELVLRFLAAHPPLAFFRSGSNLFDVIIVGVAFLPSSQFFSVARRLRDWKRDSNQVKKPSHLATASAQVSNASSARS
jgi:hypothetical protein